MALRTYSLETGDEISIEPPRPEKPSKGSRLADAGLDVAKGVVDYGSSLVGIVDLLSFGAAGKGMQAIGYDPQRTGQWLSGFYSDARKQANEKVENAQGFMDTAFAALENPSTILGSVLQSLPSTVGMGAVGYRVADQAFRVAQTGALAGGATAAAAKQAGVEAVKAAMPKILGAASAAEGAQAAGSIAQQAKAEGKEWAEYVLPSLGGGTGTAAISRVSGGIANRLGLGNVETAIATAGKGVDQGVTGGIITRALKGAAGEGVLEELPQSAQEQAFTNLATGKPVMEGVANAAAMGMLTGAAMGGANAAISRPAPSPAQTVAAIGAAPNVDAAIAAASQAADAVSPLVAPDTGEPLGFVGRAMGMPGSGMAGVPADAMQAMAEGLSGVPEMAAYLKEGVPYTGGAPAPLTEQQEIDRDLAAAAEQRKRDAIDADLRANTIPFEAPQTWMTQGMGMAAAEMGATKGSISPMEAPRIGREIDAAYAQRDAQQAQERDRGIGILARQLQDENLARETARAEAAGATSPTLTPMQAAMLMARLERDLRETRAAALAIPAPPQKGDDAAPGGPVAAPAEGAGGAALPQVSKAYTRFQKQPLSDDRLKDETTRAYLDAVVGQAGWDEMGGAMIVDEANRDRTPGFGTVLGRTSYLGEDWWRNRPENARIPGDTKGDKTSEAVRKAVAGEPMSAVERRAVQYALDVAQQRAAEDAQDEREAGIDELPQDEQDAAVALADDVAVTVASGDWASMSEAEREAELDAIFGPATAASQGGETVAAGEGGGAQAGEDQARPESATPAPEVAPPAPQPAQTTPSPEGVSTSAQDSERLKGRKVNLDVEIGDTGKTATMTIDAGQSIEDIDQRIAALRDLRECVK